MPWPVFADEIIIHLFQQDKKRLPRMGVRSLKSKIAINISVFLLIGMVSIDFVTMMTAQRTLIRAEVAKGRAVAKALNGYLLLPGMRDDPL